MTDALQSAPVSAQPETSFTHGPWHPGHLGSDITCQCAGVVDEEYPGGVCTIHIDNGLRIGDGGNGAPPREQAISNMHLIASAPELYAALAETLAIARRNEGGDFVVRADAALSKARGLS